jgi:hypothetical protein
MDIPHFDINSLDELILDKLNACLNIKLTSFTQLEDNQNLRFVIMIDDIHRLYLYDPNI